MRKRAAATSVLSLLILLAFPGTPALAAEEGNTVAEITQLLAGSSPLRTTPGGHAPAVLGG